MPQESIFTVGDGVDTANALAKKFSNRETLFQIPTWQSVVRATSDYAYQELYGFLPVDREDFPEYFDLSQSVENVLMREGRTCLTELIPVGTSHEDAYVFGEKFEIWRDRALGRITPQDESPELTEAVLTTMTLDTLASLTSSTIGKITSYIAKGEIGIGTRDFWDEEKKAWEFRNEFVGISRRIALYMNVPTL